MNDKNLPESILWFIDLSVPPEEAFKNIEDYKSKGTRIHIYYAGNDVSAHPSWYGNYNLEHAEKIHEKASETAEKRLDHICDRYLSGCSFYERHAHVGDSVKEVADLISREKIDLAVFSHGIDRDDSVLLKLKSEIEKNLDLPVKVI